MKTNWFIMAALAAVTLLGGCSRSREKAERERQWLELEEQAQRDLKRSNDAVNEVSKKLGRKPPEMDLGLPEETKTAPASTPKPKTEPQP